MSMPSVVTAIRASILTVAFLVFLATAGSAGATKQRRAADANAAGSVIVCEAFGGSASISVDGFQLDVDGQVGPSRTSTTTCSGGLLDGMSCGNYEGGWTSCSAGRMQGQPSVRMEPSAGIEPIDSRPEESGVGTPEIVASSVPENETVDAQSVVEEASPEEGSTADPSINVTHEADPATDPGQGKSIDVTAEPVISDSGIGEQATNGVADASGSAVEGVIEPLVVQTAHAASAGDAALFEATEDGIR